MKKTMCELFAGVGGFRLGLERASSDWETVWFSQWEPDKVKQWAHECYVSHWGDIGENTGVDIARVDKRDIPDHSLLVGGFPCQDYSVARPLPGSSGIEGKKGVLWWQIRDTLEIKSPPFALFENVDRLLRSPASQRGRDFGVILKCLSDLNYSAQWRVINAADYGAGQRRRRVFIFAYKNETAYAKGLSCLSSEAIVKAEGIFAKVFPVESAEKSKSAAVVSECVSEISANFCFDFENAGHMRKGDVFTSKATPIFEPPIPLSALLQPNVPEKYYLSEDMGKWVRLKGAKSEPRTSKSGHQYIFKEGAIAFPDPIDMPARTMLTSEASLNRSTHVIRDPQTNRLRLLTPLEAERIQGFDDNWTDTGMPERSRYFCMGNALVVPIITRIGRELNTIFENE